MAEMYQLRNIFSEIDDFCNNLSRHTFKYLLESDRVPKTKTGPSCCLSDSEIMTILILFQMVRFRDFKTFYCNFVQKNWLSYFPKLPSYNRFVELMKRVIFPMTLFVHYKNGRKNNIYYIDSSCLPVCHLKRSKRHATFDNVAQYGKTSVGW
ncbi:MAG: transposase, partial [Gammaproteobacteria bacterium]